MHQIRLRYLAAQCARAVENLPSLESEGAGNAGCALHPRSRVQTVRKHAHEHTGSAETLRHPPRNGFTAYAVISSATNSSCHRHRRIEILGLPGWANQNLRRFDTSNGCQNHTLLPSASQLHQVPRRIVHPHRSFRETGKQRRSSARSASLTEDRPAISFARRRCYVHRILSRVS